MTPASFEKWSRYAIGVTAAAIVGCTPAARATTTTTAAPLVIPPLRTAKPASDALAVRFAEGAAPPSGCFALSRRTGAVACILGQYRLEAAPGERYLSILSNGDDALPNVTVRVEHGESGLRLEPESQRMLDALMREGDFIALGPPVIVAPDGPHTFGLLTVELRREEIPAIPLTRWDLKVLVRREPGSETANGDAGESGEGALLENTMTSAACHDPTLAVRMLEPSVVLVERECRTADGPDVEVTIGAWLCDGDRSRCD